MEAKDWGHGKGDEASSVLLCALNFRLLSTSTALFSWWTAVSNVCGWPDAIAPTSTNVFTGMQLWWLTWDFLHLSLPTMCVWWCGDLSKDFLWVTDHWWFNRKDSFWRIFSLFRCQCQAGPTFPLRCLSPPFTSLSTRELYLPKSGRFLMVFLISAQNALFSASSSSPSFYRKRNLSG